jgi:hypothetical protein
MTPAQIALEDFKKAIREDNKLPAELRDAILKACDTPNFDLTTLKDWIR